MAKADRRIQRTRELLQKSLIDLIGERGYDAITVQDIVAPVVTAPPAVTIACTDSHDPTVTTVLGVGTAEDACSGASTPTYSDAAPTPGSCAGNYSFVRTWTTFQ